MVEVGLADYLRQNSSLLAIIGATPPDVTPIPAPEDLNSYPCVTYQTVSYTGEYAVDGSTWVAEKRVVFNCWATTWLQAHTILELVRGALEGYSGFAPDGTYIFLTEIDGEEDFFESESRLYRASLHILVQYAEA